MSENVVRTFANDIKLYHTITSESDCNILQQNLNNIMDWGTMWLTSFNLHKCKVLSLGIQVNYKNICSMLSTGEDHQLDGVEEEKDLGVLFSPSLKFGGHINKE